MPGLAADGGICYNRLSMGSEHNLTHWADQTAEKILRERGSLEGGGRRGSFTCAAGITPSGTVHIGNFREIISVELVARALRERGVEARFIYSWDDFDVFRKVPANMPHPETLQKYLRFPITMVPDTTGRDESYARHNEADVEVVLPKVGIYPEFLYQAERYMSGMYAEGIRAALQKRAVIKECLNRFRDEKHKMAEDEEYWPVSVFCSCCRRDTTRIEGYDGEWRVSYSCECGHKEDADIRSLKGIKLGWRVDWPMRWAREQVVFEPAGKDHHSQGGSFDTAALVAKEVFDWQAPVSFRYDFIGIKGAAGKMSSSEGNAVSLADVLKVYQPEVARYLFAGTRPNTEFDISFDLDVIKIYEDYDRCERVALGIEKAKSDAAFRKERRIWELSQVDPGSLPQTPSCPVPFRHLCNILQINAGNIDAAISSLEDIKEEQLERLRARAECAWHWIEHCAPDDFRFSLATPDKARAASFSEGDIGAARALLEQVAPIVEGASEKEISAALYACAESLGLQPKELFAACYRLLVGKEQGPRLASFLKIIGEARLKEILLAAIA